MIKTDEQKQWLLEEMINSAYQLIEHNWPENELKNTLPYLEIIERCQQIQKEIGIDSLQDKQIVEEWMDFLKKSNVEFEQINDNLIKYYGIYSGYESENRDFVEDAKNKTGFLLISNNRFKRMKLADKWSRSLNILVSVGRLPTNDEWDHMYLDQTSDWELYCDGEPSEYGSIVLSRYRYDNDWHKKDDLIWISSCAAGKEWLEPYHLRK